MAILCENMGPGGWLAPAEEELTASLVGWALVED